MISLILVTFLVHSSLQANVTVNQLPQANTSLTATDTKIKNVPVCKDCALSNNFSQEFKKTVDKIKTAVTTSIEKVGTFFSDIFKPNLKPSEKQVTSNNSNDNPLEQKCIFSEIKNFFTPKADTPSDATR